MHKVENYPSTLCCVHKGGEPYAPHCADVHSVRLLCVSVLVSVHCCSTLCVLRSVLHCVCCALHPTACAALCTALCVLRSAPHCAFCALRCTVCVALCTALHVQGVWGDLIRGGGG